MGREGHVSGPKYCDGIFYPQVFAKKLRYQFVILCQPVLCVTVKILDAGDVPQLQTGGV